MAARLISRRQRIGLRAFFRKDHPPMSFPTTHPALARALAAREYAQPTAVQTAVLEPEAQGRDLLVSAQTGSGKTVAFGLALAPVTLVDKETFDRASQPLALIIAPTRELAMQVQRELLWLYAETQARIITCVGGMDVRAEARRLADGAHIVVGTPGRLRDHLERGRLDLSQLKVIVLDEADEMLDLGFREDLEFILDATPSERQTLLFSATMPPEIEALAKRYQKDAHRIQTLRRNEQHADIEYQAIRVAPHDVEHSVVNVLRFYETRAAIVFCSTREGVKRLHSKLAERGFSAVALSGELTQTERSQALQALRDGRARVLVATDVAARGLDLPDLALVIHADLPHDAETLLHRSGRTGRAGKKGLCVVIVPFNRRRKADTLLQVAKLKVAWVAAPTPDQIRAKDQERLLADPIFTDAASEEEAELLGMLKASKSADEIALAFVRMSRARLPAPEDLAEDTGPPPRKDAWKQRATDGFERRGRDGGRTSETDRSAPPRRLRDDGREMVWFRLSIGRERNADPRWLLPLICKAGKVSKAEIGAIKIFDRDTRFQIVAEAADRFTQALDEGSPKDARITRLGANAPDAPHDATASEPSAARTTQRPFHERSDKSHFSAPKQPRRPDDGRRRDEQSQRGEAKSGWSKPRWSGDRSKPAQEERRAHGAGGSGKPSFKGAGKPWAGGGADDGRQASKYAHKKKGRPGHSAAPSPQQRGAGKKPD